MLNLVFGTLAVVLTVVAYYQTDRLRFLKINVFAVSFFGLTLYVNNGISGALVSLVNVLIYIIAIYTSKAVRKKLTYILPLIAFAIALQSFEANIAELDLPFTVKERLAYIPAFATFFVSLSALQHSIIINKLLLFVGVAIWASYGYLLSAWFAVAADLFGLFVIMLSLRSIHAQDSAT